MSSKEKGLSSSWTRKEQIALFRPNNEQRSDSLRSDHGRLGCNGVGSSRGAISDATGFKTLRAYDHFAAMVFAQLTYRESLRGIEACLNARPALAYHMGIRGRVTRTNLAYANDHRDWRAFAEVAAVLMRRAQRLQADTPPELGLEADLFALDATVIELSLTLFPWARWKKTLASVKLNVLLDLRGDIPVFASLHEGNATRWLRSTNCRCSRGVTT